MSIRTFSVVTTCHKEGYDLYGRRMVETFDRHWPREIVLDLYTENFKPDIISDRIVCLDLLAECPELVAFKQRHQDNPLAHGSASEKHWKVRIDWRKPKLKLRRKQNLGYRWDAVRFSHKTFSIFAAAERCATDVLFWVDADIQFFADIPFEFLEETIPPDCMVSFLARPQFSECGFVGYNLRHPATGKFLKQFKALYTTDSLFKEDQWHDSYLFDVVRKRFEKKGHRTYDIGKGMGEEVGHVFINSDLGRYMDHMKGDRKITGSSYGSDLKVDRDEAYWKEKSNHSTNS